MINFIDGKIVLGSRMVDVRCDDEDLYKLASEGLLEKRREPGGNGDHFYAEVTEETTRLSIIISVRKKKIEYVLLRWLDSPMKGWDDVSDDLLQKEYHMLSRFVERKVSRPSDIKKNRQRSWLFKWGQVNVSYDPRSANVAIYMWVRSGV